MPVSQPKPYILIVHDGGIIEEVHGLPPGWSWQGLDMYDPDQDEDDAIAEMKQNNIDAGICHGR